jgi:hypothetical protein
MFWTRIKQPKTDRRNEYRVREEVISECGAYRVRWWAEYRRPGPHESWYSANPSYSPYVSKADAIAACNYHASPETDPSITNLGRLP